jgi:endonuclease G
MTIFSLIGKSFPAVVASLFLGVSPPASAQTACGQHFFRGEVPSIINARMRSGLQEVCFSEFAVMHSSVTRTPLYSARHLNRDRLQAAQSMDRIDSFHEEVALRGSGANLRDYERSGFDRGHMSPNKDMGTRQGQAESFSLSNMVPQDPNNNRCLWEGVESAIRDMTKRAGEAWVVTGPAFVTNAQSPRLRQLNGRVTVPSHVWSAVFIPSSGQAAAYVAPNEPGMEYHLVSIADLRQMTGIDPFPGVPEAAKSAVPNFPEPRPHNVGGSCSQGPQTNGRSGGHEPAPTGGGASFMRTIARWMR